MIVPPPAAIAFSIVFVRLQRQIERGSGGCRGEIRQLRDDRRGNSASR